jgi:hypothetical protein
MSRKEYAIKLDKLVNENNFEEFKKICQFLRENHIDYLGYLLEKKNDESKIYPIKMYPQIYLDLLEEYFESSTTLRKMFESSNFLEIKFLNSKLKFQRPIELLDITRTYFGDGVFPKNDKFSEMDSFFEGDNKNPFVYPEILDIDFKLKEFYVEKMPMNYYTSLRQPQSLLAKNFYLQIITNNQYSENEIALFKEKYFTESLYSDNEDE